MLGSTLTRLRSCLVAQAVVTGVLAVTGPFDAGRWLPFVAGVATGALVLALFVGQRTRSAWTMTLGFEVLALAVGATGAVNGYYVPGTALSLVVLAVLLLPAGRAAFTTVPATAPVRLSPPPVSSAVPPPPPGALPPPPPSFPPPGLLVAAGVPAGPISGTAPSVMPPSAMVPSVMPHSALPPSQATPSVMPTTPAPAPVQLLGGDILPGR